MDRLKRLLIAGSCVVLLSTPIGCQETVGSAGVLPLPEGIDAITRVRVAEIVSDEDAADLYSFCAAMVGNPSMPSTLEGALDEVEADIGFDLRYIKEATLFADLSTLSSDAPYFGALVRCRVPAKYLFEASRAFGMSRLPVQEHNGHKVYCLNSDLGFAFLDAKLLVAGPLTAVMDVIDTATGHLAPGRGEVYDLFKGLTEAPVSVVFSLPSDLRNDVLDTLERSRPTATPLPLKDLSVAACELVKNGDTVTARAALHCVNASSTESVKAFVEGDLGRSLALCPATEIQDVLRRVEVVTYNCVVGVSLDITLADVRDCLYALRGTGR